jgi:hypothetical protein
MSVVVTTTRVSTPPFCVVGVYWLVCSCIIFGRRYIEKYLLMMTQVDVETRMLDTQKCYVGHAVAQLVEALRYKPEGRGFDRNFALT